MVAPEDHDVAPYGLIGRKLGHSWSPQIHAALGSSPYTLREVEPEGLSDLVLGDTSWRGLNVTIPYKADVLGLADEVTPLARRLGAANTLVRNSDGTILADNTDAAGFAWMLERFCLRELGGSAHDALSGLEVLVLGSGGASKAVRSAIEDVGARAFVISRTGNDTYDTLLDRHAHAALVVNTTPVGMFPSCPATPISEKTLSSLPCLKGVLDVVYNPRRTGICLAADHLGIPSESGLAMLVAQARRSSEVFQGTSLPDERVGQIEDQLMRQMVDVFLIGMPGCGKSGAGRRLAHRVHRPFVDLDDVIAIDADMDIPTFFSLHGEAAFRDLETKALSDYAKQTGIVVACGGGIVERPENLDLMRQNGYVVMLDRPLGELSLGGRPVTAQKGVERLASERMGRYRSWADMVLPCTGSAEGDAIAIAKAYHL